MIISCQEAIKSRRSIRKFESRNVPAEDLEQIIEAARLAPSGTNRQPWRFALLISKEEKEKIAGAVVQPFIVAAPAVFVCCLDRGAYVRRLVEERMKELVQAEVISKEAAGYIYQRKMPEQVEDVVIPASAYLDLGIAVENMALMATALGLGSCWVRLFNPQQVHETLGLPQEIEVVALLPVGYPVQSPSPRPRLSRDEIMIKLSN
ncbi:MAG: nitroreductase family protein [Clostridia bacterium]|nr:nitroreductase family protein [Clostridia bacterium]